MNNKQAAAAMQEACLARLREMADNHQGAVEHELEALIPNWETVRTYSGFCKGLGIGMNAIRNLKPEEIIGE